ncbi:MAG TPA: nucleotide exchange factor GrpE [Candidatus Baltobacteraceae bacterium]|nr:nucleotide exchange factor GrpE [Candidatus Baltobacteraceae bacterium]
MNDRPPEHRRAHRTRAQERIDALETPTAPQLLAQVEELRVALAAAQQEAGDDRAGWQRAVADFANFKRRTELEREATLGLANELLLLKVLAVADDFDRAMAAVPPELAGNGWVEGIGAIDRKLRQLLESEGVTPIQAVGQPFDPREHEAVVHEETSSAPDDTVLTELQRGYRLRDRVLRPALVSVARNPGHQAAPARED